jgi:hypothetical protein
MVQRIHKIALHRPAARITLAAALLLTACDALAPITSKQTNAANLGAQAPTSKPTRANVDIAQDAKYDTANALPQRSAASREVAAYYEALQRQLLSRGLMRTDTGEDDVPLTAHILASNFDAIALNVEYIDIGGELIAHSEPTTLYRWDVPVRIGVEFGDSIPARQRAHDLETVADLVPRLAQATRHTITQTQDSTEPTNFHVLILNEEERQAIGPRLNELIPGIGATTIRAVENMPRTSYCAVIASDPADDGARRTAVAVIRGEHPDLLRRLCLHEEITQGLGLVNDSPHARPSIFNDDEEFALLTKHDELLLRLLYDERLRPGMSPEIARHISTQIAQELLGDPL